MSARTVLEALALLAIGAAWYFMRPAPATVNTWQPAKESREVALVPKEVIHPDKVEVYAPIAKKKLKLPDAIQNDANAVVIASNKVSADERPHTITTLLDKETGKVTTLERVDEYPWLKLENRREILLSYGLRGAETMGRITGTWDFVQTKGAHWGIVGSLDTDGQRYIGASVAFRF